ncbi:hypothetical protein LYNGBM3L_12640 [Moorena producens 3L]|uniref:Uncharacterized protein n=1 Tax=Moorena producens 3L TaxID=489825 RepID=F4XKU6_9CYAN|nr:hypothetical protein LYNGBM3L_12640 [Moorena producens 3L]
MANGEWVIANCNLIPNSQFSITKGEKKFVAGRHDN